jgi:hypothetical protein
MTNREPVPNADERRLILKRASVMVVDIRFLMMAASGWTCPEPTAYWTRDIEIRATDITGRIPRL